MLMSEKIVVGSLAWHNRLVRVIGSGGVKSKIRGRVGCNCGNTVGDTTRFWSSDRIDEGSNHVC